MNLGSLGTATSRAGSFIHRGGAWHGGGALLLIHFAVLVPERTRELNVPEASCRSCHWAGTWSRTALRLTCSLCPTHCPTLRPHCSPHCRSALLQTGRNISKLQNFRLRTVGFARLMKSPNFHLTLHSQFPHQSQCTCWHAN